MNDTKSASIAPQISSSLILYSVNSVPLWFFKKGGSQSGFDMNVTDIRKLCRTSPLASPNSRGL